MDQQPEYPWFTVTRGKLLEQGDLLRACPRFVLPSTLAQTNNGDAERRVVDAVVLTQACDLAVRPDGQCEATDVLLCPFFFKKDLTDHAGDRLRLLPPYREHLSQAFARLLMRVGLPADIPPFGKKK